MGAVLKGPEGWGKELVDRSGESGRTGNATGSMGEPVFFSVLEKLMAYIEQIAEEEATGAVGALYAEAVDRAGGVANIIKVMSRDAVTLRGSMLFYVSLMKAPNALAPAQREMLAVVVSNLNDCYY